MVILYSICWAKNKEIYEESTTPLEDTIKYAEQAINHEIDALNMKNNQKLKTDVVEKINSTDNIAYKEYLKQKQELREHI